MSFLCPNPLMASFLNQHKGTFFTVVWVTGPHLCWLSCCHAKHQIPSAGSSLAASLTGILPPAMSLLKSPIFSGAFPEHSGLKVQPISSPPLLFSSSRAVLLCKFLFIACLYKLKISTVRAGSWSVLFIHISPAHCWMNQSAYFYPEERWVLFEYIELSKW